MYTLLDLFCCAGGSSMGYHRAGFKVTGVDIDPQPRYPFEFHQADALAFLREHGHEYDAIAASPPCQRFSVATKGHPGLAETYPDLIGPTREILETLGKPYIIENVPAAPLRNPVTLCGTMFPELRVYRHRKFESNVPLRVPEHRPHPERIPRAGRGVSPGGWISVAGHVSDVAAARRAMGIDWTNRHELAEAIPPAYTEYLGKQLLEWLEVRDAGS